VDGVREKGRELSVSERVLRAMNPQQMFVLIIKPLRNNDIKVIVHLCISLVVFFLFK